MTDKPITPSRPVRVGNTPPSSAAELAEGKGSRSRAGWFDAANVHGFHPTDDELDRGWIEWFSVRRAVILQSPDDTGYQNNLRRLLNSDCERGACVCREAQKRAGGTYMLCTDEDGQGFTHQTPARTETEYLVGSSVFLSWLFAQGLSPSKHVTAWNTAIANPAPAQNTATPPTTTGTVKPASDGSPKRIAKKPTIESVALDYMRDAYKAGQFKSASNFHKHLCKTAGQSGSPFEMGIGENARKLFCPAASSFFDAGTLSKIWAKIRAA